MQILSSRIADIDSMDISIKEIMYFITIVESGSITKASQILFVAQPYLSKMIQRMEKNIGVQLFERTGKSIVLTAAGREFYERMSRVLGMMAEGYEKTRNIGNRSETVLNTAVSYDLDPVKLSSGYSGLKELFDRSSIDCMHFYDIFDGIGAGLIDCAVIFRDYVNHFPQCICRDLGQIQTCVLVSADHIFADKLSVTSKEMQKEEICFYIERSTENKLLQSALLNYCNEINVDPGDTHIASNYLTALQYAVSHKAVVIGNTYSLIPDSGMIRAVPVSDSTQSLCVIYPEQLSDYKKEIIENVLYANAE